MQYRIVLALACLHLSVASFAREKEAYCAWDTDITEDFIEAVDSRLPSNRSQEAAQIIADNLPFPIPSSNIRTNNEEILVQPHFITWYDKDLRAPLWVAYRLTADDINDGVTRSDSFRSDPRLDYWERSDCADYKEDIFDQGHMVPSADMKRSEEAMATTFLMSNMTAQHCQFNRGPWQVLEELTRRWADSHGEVWVIAGTLFDRYGDQSRDADQVAWRMTGKRGTRVAIPSHQYRIIVRKEAEQTEAISFLLSNDDSEVSNDSMRDYLAASITTLEHIADRSGISFDEALTAIEATDLWAFPGRMPKSLAYNCKADYPEY
ncbi:MAG: DNA/RNA non-specific endonuclease [Alcanivoracaceae bacterium]|nr:DNA/RNA non-specific endonuclease [Alcanivoracaceae bacterium]